MDITETARRAPEPDAFDRRADELIAQMTVEEKIFQMMHIAAGIPRLGIRPYIWWNEALHGVARAGVATVFPQAIGMAASFDAPLLRRVADVISTDPGGRPRPPQGGRVRQALCGAQRPGGGAPPF